MDAGDRSNNGGDEEYRSWLQRAESTMEIYPVYRVGATMAGRPLSVPYAPQTLRAIPGFTFTAVDVPSAGNCLFHAVWQAAKLQGVLKPFGLRGVDHFSCAAYSLVPARRRCFEAE